MRVCVRVCESETSREHLDERLVTLRALLVWYFCRLCFFPHSEKFTVARLEKKKQNPPRSSWTVIIYFLFFLLAINPTTSYFRLCYGVVLLFVFQATAGVVFFPRVSPGK